MMLTSQLCCQAMRKFRNDKKAYAKSFYFQYLNTDHFNAKTLVEPYQGWYVVQNRPNRPLKRKRV